MASTNEEENIDIDGFIEFGKDDIESPAGTDSEEDALFDISGIAIEDPDVQDEKNTIFDDEAEESAEGTSEEEAADIGGKTEIFDDSDDDSVDSDDIEDDAGSDSDADSDEVGDEEAAGEEDTAEDSHRTKHEPHIFGNRNEQYDDFDDFFGLADDTPDDDFDEPQKTVEENLEAIGKASHNSGVSVTDTTKPKKIVKKSQKINKGTRFFGLSGKILGLILMAVFLIDMVALNSASYKVVYSIVCKILLANGIEALRLDNPSMIGIFVGVSYIVSLILGGLIVAFVASLINKVLDLVSFPGGTKATFYTTLVFAFIFFIGGIIAALTMGSLLTFTVYRWMGPFMTYIGGVVFMLLARFKIMISK